MDISGPSIVYISSDEESEIAVSKKGKYSHDSGRFCDREDHDWLSEILGEVDKKNDYVSDDSDDVVLVSEVFSKPKKPRLCPVASSKIVVYNEGNYKDDDCVVLDCNPDPSTVLENARADNYDVSRNVDSDDLEIVSEKSEVACRDFPHPRHLCGNFTFDSTPHEVHCSQCHCYVCDSIAPCARWGAGVSSFDHCHASDKEKFWRSERQRFRKGNHPVVTRPCITDYFSEFPQEITAPALPYSLPKNLHLRPTMSRPFSPSTTNRIPNALNPGRDHLVGHVSRDRQQLQYIPEQLHMTSHTSIPSMNSNCSSLNRGPRFIHSPVFKRLGYTQALPNTQHGYARRQHGSQLSRDSLLKRPPTMQTSMMNHSEGLNDQQNLCRHADSSMVLQSKFPAPQSMNMELTNCIPSQSQLQSQPFSAFQREESTSCQLQMFSQSNVSNNLEDVALQPDHAFQLNSPIPVQASVFKLPNSGNEFEKQMHSLSVIPCDQNQSSQFHAYSEPTSFLIGNQHTSQPSPQLQTADLGVRPDSSISHATAQDSADLGVRPDSSISHDTAQDSADLGVRPDSSISHATAQDSPDTSRLSVAADNSQHRSVTENSHNQWMTQADNPHLINEPRCPFPGSTFSDSLDFPFDNWVFENQSFPGDLEVNALPLDLSVFSPEHASIDGVLQKSRKTEHRA